jgi:hypothetical protein
MVIPSELREPLPEIEARHHQYEVPLNAPGYVGFGASGGGEMYAFSPRGDVVCLAFIGMAPREELAVASSWQVFEEMLRGAI